MTYFSAFLLTVMSFVSAQSGTQVPECRDWQTCRQLALEAAARQDYDAFHDLAWRALRTGPKNDPALMTLVARAQSLNHRPHDALVMLQRLAAMGVTTDAATSDDFRSVRELAGWAEFEARTSGAGGRVVSDAAPSLPSVTPAPKPSAETRPTPSPTADVAETPRKTAPDPTSPVRFPATGIAAVGLAYDAVSGRFIVGDRQEHRLAVIGERSRRVASLAGADGGFGEIAAFEIDVREGDLWVVTSPAGSRSSSGAATVHKLQLISGRHLSSIELAAENGPARFADVAVGDSSIFVLDSGGRRLFRAAKKARSIETVVRLAAADVVSLAPASDTIVYAAYDQGILRVDLPTRSMSVVDPGQRADLAGLTWIRWHRGSIIGAQKAAGDRYRIVRIRLDDAGRTSRGVEVLTDGIHIVSATSLTLSGNTLYYLSPADSSEFVVKKLTVK
jgi:hypothetical protein